MSPVATETPTPGWGLGPTPAYTVIYTGKLHHDRGRYPLQKPLLLQLLEHVTAICSPADGGLEVAF
jgi:hypothetical protein